jgi:hypothetical protein
VNRVFKTRHFARWMRKSALTDEALCAAIDEMRQGLIDADLGGGIVKKRVALPGRGKRGGARTLVATRKADRWFYVFGFEKNERATVSAAELEALQILAEELLSRTDKDLDALMQTDKLIEMCYGYQN